MRKVFIFSMICLLFACSKETDEASQQRVLPGQGEDEGKIVLYRDTWGVPHIYAPTIDKGLFAQGYAQAEDRPEQLLMNIKIAMGELASIAGPDQVPSDLLSKMFDHYGNARHFLNNLAESDRRSIEAFAAGINRYYSEHPQSVPEWWQYSSVTPTMVDAFGRLFLYNWSIDEAIKDLNRGGIDPGFIVEQRASNQWAVSPERSATGHAMLVIDPHLTWWGPSRFWEMRIHAGDLHGSGVGLAGSPYIGLGHNDKLAWAMTTGGPDTADVYELTLNPDNENQYLYEGEYKDLRIEQVRLEVKGEGTKSFQISYSHHGPVLAKADGKAYAGKIPYDQNTDRNAAWVALNFADDYKGAVEAGATLSMFPQNLMVADTSGNIYYERVGRVPVRPDGFDFTRPVDGSTSKSEWQGLHPSTDHVQILNPQAGYMQNCNIPPDAMMVKGPFKLKDYPDYIYSSAHYGPVFDGWNNQRGARILEQLSGNGKVRLEDMFSYVLDVKPYGAERWLDALREASGEPNADEKALLAWDGQLSKESSGALKYAYWRFQLRDHAQSAEIRRAVDDYYAVVENRVARPLNLSTKQKTILRETFRLAMDKMRSELGGTDVPYGRVFRVGRDKKSWPVGGGGGRRLGLTTLRTVDYTDPNEKFERWGKSGQTSTQVVELSVPIKSWIYLPVGQSDIPESDHYSDQAEKLFQNRKLKPSWWLPEELVDHIASRKELSYGL